MYKMCGSAYNLLTTVLENQYLLVATHLMVRYLKHY